MPISLYISGMETQNVTYSRERLMQEYTNSLTMITAALTATAAPQFKVILAGEPKILPRNVAPRLKNDLQRRYKEIGSNLAEVAKAYDAPNPADLNERETACSQKALLITRLKQQLENLIFTELYQNILEITACNIMLQELEKVQAKARMQPFFEWATVKVRQDRINLENAKQISSESVNVRSLINYFTKLKTE
jgi:ATP-dependent exoDNAse (exonuclease V) beta subunit